MLACDLILEVRASRSLSAGQVAWLERTVFGEGADAQYLDLLVIIDTYAERFDPSWTALLARAGLARRAARHPEHAAAPPAQAA